MNDGCAGCHGSQLSYHIYQIKLCDDCDEKMKEQGLFHNSERDNYRGYLSILLTWLETGIPEKEVGHSCGQPDAFCDQNCVDFARFCADVSRIKKAINHKMISVDVSDCDATKIISDTRIDKSKFMQYYYVSIKEDGPKEGWTKLQHEVIGHVYRIDEIDWEKKNPIRLSCSPTLWWHPNDLSPEDTR